MPSQRLITRLSSSTLFIYTGAKIAQARIRLTMSQIHALFLVEGKVFSFKEVFKHFSALLSASGRWDLILHTRIFAKVGVAGFSNGFACLLNRALQSIHRDKWRFCSQSGALQTSAYCLIHLGQYNSPCSLKARLLFRLLMKFHYIALKNFNSKFMC